MSSFTPGPWTSEPDGTGDFTIASTRDPLAIASVVNGQFMAMGGHSDEQEANARLIAAAPDLLEALKHCLGWIDAWDPNFTQDDAWPEYRAAFNAAISKATGTTP